MSNVKDLCKLVPIIVTPLFVRDNQYNTKYKVICKDVEPQLFNSLVDLHGKEKVVCFPSGRICLFCTIEL